MAIEIEGMTPLLQVFDMPTSVDFYCGTLGFELINTSQPGKHFGWALLRLNGVDLMLNTAYDDERRPPSPDPKHIAAHADIALYFACPQVDQVYSYLVAKGLKVKEPTVAYYGMKQLYVTDPDGYNLCFQWPA